LGDKTPFHHNRQDPLSTPAPQTFKIVKFALEEDEPELLWPSTIAPTSTHLRPSSTRKGVRGRLSGGDDDKEKEEERFGPLGLKGLQLQTPMNPKNRHWDLGDLDLDTTVETEPIAEEVEEDDDEIEYMPPKFEVPYQPPFDFEMPNYKALGAKLREMAHSYKYEDDPVLEDFDYVFDVSQTELELLNPVNPVPSSDDDDNLFLGSSTSTLKPKSSSKTPKPSIVPSKIPVTKTLPVTQRLATRTRPTTVSTSRPKTVSTTRATKPANTIRTVPAITTTKTRPTTASRPTNITKPALTARPVRSGANAKAISPRKQVVSRAATSLVRPMKSLVLVQKSNTTGSSSTTRSAVASRPPSSATARKTGTIASTVTGKKPTRVTLKEKEDDLILKFDVEVEVEDFQFDV